MRRVNSKVLICRCATPWQQHGASQWTLSEASRGKTADRWVQADKLPGAAICLLPLKGSTERKDIGSKLWNARQDLQITNRTSRLPFIPQVNKTCAAYKRLWFKNAEYTICWDEAWIFSAANIKAHQLTSTFSLTLPSSSQSSICLFSKSLPCNRTLYQFLVSTIRVTW